MQNPFKKIKTLKVKVPKSIDLQMVMGTLGILLVPIDSFRYFPINSDNRPIWIIPFIALFFFHVLQRQTVKKYVIVSVVIILYFVAKSFVLYNVYDYPNYSGLVKGAMVLLLMLFSIAGVNQFFKRLYTKYEANYLSRFADLVVYSSFLPILIGIFQLANVVGFRLLGQFSQPLTTLFSMRYNSEVRLQLTTGEPAWAATYLIFVFLFTALFYSGKFKKLLLFVYTLFFLLTGSTLGFLYAAVIGVIYLFLFLNTRLLFRASLFLFLSLLLGIYLYSLLPDYTKHKMELVSTLISNLSVKQILLFAAMDFSFISRFLNPVIGFKLGVDSYLFGVGIEAFQYHVIDELRAWGLLEGATENYINALLSSGATPKFLFSKIFCELGAIAFFSAAAYYLWVLGKNWKSKKMVLLIISTIVLVFNFDSYLFYVPLIILVIASKHFQLVQNSYSE